MAKNAYSKSGGVLNGDVNATGYVKSGDGKDVVSSQDMWAKRYIYESGYRVYSPNNKPTAGDVGAYSKFESDSKFARGNVTVVQTTGAYPRIEFWSTADKRNRGFFGIEANLNDDNSQSIYLYKRKASGENIYVTSFPRKYGVLATTDDVNTRGARNTANKAVNGWWKCEDTGMIYQWGVTRVLGPQEIITVQLPVRFSDVCVSVMLTVNRRGSGDGVANGYVADLSPSSFKLTNDYANSPISVGYYWFAVGY
ncbi:hypothetical protein [Photorhabdus sp. RM323S]|uniref:gp53-like domain-containing protein n=1 Tax=Photorhabdus sp. RM323S TaxID=3342828 RepID=UPI0036DE602F